MPHRSLKTNILRNVRDQPLHALWAGASIFAPFAAHHWVGSWPLTALVFFLAWLSIGALVAREWQQFPSHDAWDFWLDLSFYCAGGAAGLVAGLLL